MSVPVSIWATAHNPAMAETRASASAASGARTRRRAMMRFPLALVLALAAVLLLARAAGAQEKTDFKEQGGEEKKKDADEEEDFVPDHEDTEENLGPFQLRKPKYRIIPGDEDPHYFGQLGLQRLAPIPAVRKAFREEARKYRDVLMRCNQPECFPPHPGVPGNVTAGNVTANATATNSSAATATAAANKTATAPGDATPAADTTAQASSGAGAGVIDDTESQKNQTKTKRKAWTPTLNAFKNMTEAYRVLSDPQKKRVYEVSGKAGLDGKYRPQFQDPLREPYKLELAFKTGTFKMDFGFKEGQQKNTGNVHHNIKIPMIGFYTGFHMDVSIVRGELCPHCNGTGAAENAEMLTCPTCKGAGKEERNSFWRAAHCPHARRRAQRYTGIHMYVCMYVYTLYTYVCILCIYMYTYMYVRKHVCIYVLHTYIYIYIYIYIL